VRPAWRRERGGIAERQALATQAADRVIEARDRAEHGERGTSKETRFFEGFAVARTRAHAKNGGAGTVIRAGHGRVCASAALLASQKPSKRRGCRGITTSDKVQLPLPFLLDDRIIARVDLLHEGAPEHGCGCAARVQHLAGHLLHLIKMLLQAPVEEDELAHAGASAGLRTRACLWHGQSGQPTLERTTRRSLHSDDRAAASCYAERTTTVAISRTAVSQSVRPRSSVGSCDRVARL
jgi:hypothetical protein